MTFRPRSFTLGNAFKGARPAPLPAAKPSAVPKTASLPKTAKAAGFLRPGVTLKLNRIPLSKVRTGSGY